jgi:hypothetical protein
VCFLSSQCWRRSECGDPLMCLPRCAAMYMCHGRHVPCTWEMPACVNTYVRTCQPQPHSHSHALSRASRAINLECLQPARASRASSSEQLAALESVRSSELAELAILLAHVVIAELAILVSNLRSIDR